MVFLLLLADACTAAEAPPPPSAGGAGAVKILAWMRFEDSGGDYKGTPYRFTGGGDLQLTIDVPPAPGHALDLLWGAKNDTRVAVIDVSGKRIPQSHGGYDGFQWLRVPIPAGISGKNYSVTIAKADGGKGAFIAEVRLVQPLQGNDSAAAPDMKASAFKMTLKQEGFAANTVTIPRGEGFPEMRALWDKSPSGLPAKLDSADAKRFGQAEKNARLAAEAFYRCRKYVDGWLAHADPKSGLIPRNLTRDKDLWNGRDSAADNYPFMVLTCALTDRPLFETRMLDILKTEIRLTSRLDRLCDNFLFSRQSWQREQIDLDAMMFDNAEYVKDGLLPLTEWLGKSPWSDRMLGITDDIFKHAPIDTPFGRIPTLNFEVNGDLLQACSRLYWFTGDKKYLDWAIRIGDFYLLGDQHPTRDMKELRLMDHGCEVLNGLTELYVALAYSSANNPAYAAKRQAYKKPLHRIFQDIIAHGANEDGLLYTSFSAKTGQHAKGLCDTWGYDFDGFYTLYLVDGETTYRDAVRKALSNLEGKYIGACWADRSADGFADSIEGAINLLNREPIESAATWCDSQIRMMWAIQKSDGVIEGWHGDGNFARTSIMYALWKTQGCHIEPWRSDVRVGAMRDGDFLYLCVAADQPWSGKILFDKARHKENLKLPIDYPRINQFAQWYTATPLKNYIVRDMGTGNEKKIAGKELLSAGLPLELKPGQPLLLRVTGK